MNSQLLGEAAGLEYVLLSAVSAAVSMVITICFIAYSIRLWPGKNSVADGQLVAVRRRRIAKLLTDGY